MTVRRKDGLANIGQNGITRTQKARALVYIIVLMGLLIVINSIVRIYTNLSIPVLSENKPTITFDGKMTFVSDNKVTFVIHNFGNNPRTKLITIYGLNLPYKNSSDIIDTSGKTVNIDITRDDSTSSQDNQLTVTVLDITPGSYEGALFFNKDTAVPITIATEPKVLQAVIWIVIGILASIIYWEFIIHHKDPKKSNDRYEPNESPTRRLWGTGKSIRPKRKIISIDSGTIVFGIGVGLLTVLNQGYVNTIRVIEILDILAFLGTGLGIGSLREFAAKVAE